MTPVLRHQAGELEWSATQHANTGKTARYRGSATACARLEMWAPSTQSRPASRNWPPAPAIARQKLVGFIRPLATSLIERKPIRSRATPCIQERLDHSPTGLDPIRPLEQDRVPDHAIIDQRLVAGARCGVKIILVFKCHADARNRDHRTRHLGAELQTDALVGLNADDQEILRQPVNRRVAKHGERSLLELDRHFSSLRLERLSSAEIEWNTRPAPIVDHELECDVGFGCAVWGHIGRSTVILDFVVSHPRRQILRAHRVSQRIRLARYMHLPSM